jgi:transcriptional regulator with XRE-family HTH domain
MKRRHFLRTLRLRRHLTQKDLERLTNREVAQNTISKLESNPDAHPEFQTVVALAKALKVSPDQIRFGPDPEIGLRQTRTPRELAS